MAVKIILFSKPSSFAVAMTSSRAGKLLVA